MTDVPTENLLQLRLEFVQGAPDPAILECELDVQNHWYGDTPEEIDEAYGPWADMTVWLAVRAATGRVVGASRLIIPGSLPQRTLAEASAPPWNLDGDRLAAELGIDPSAAWDVATINVRRELGRAGSRVAEALYYGIFHAPSINGGKWLLAMLDVRVRRLLQRVGFVMHPLPGAAPEPYMGSPALAPVYAGLDRLVRDQQRNHRDDYVRIILGRGLDGIDVPAPDDFVLASPVVVDLTEQVTPAP